MDVNVLRHVHPAELGAVVLRLLDVKARDDPVAQDVLLVVDVVEEEVQRDDPLGQARLQVLPLRARDHPRLLHHGARLVQRGLCGFQRGFAALQRFHGAVLQLAGEIIVNVRELSQLGWTPATSSNFSHRLDDQHAAITVSGRDKGRLIEDDIMVVDFDGKAVGSDHRPSAETLLHTQLYRRFRDIGCILHTHSPTQTIASRLFADEGHVRLEGYELLKAFAGNRTHEMAVDVPVFANTFPSPSTGLSILVSISWTL